MTIRRSQRSLKIFAQAIQALQRPVLQEADLAIAFLAAQPDSSFPGTLTCSQIRGSFQRHVKTLEEFGALQFFDSHSEAPCYRIALQKTVSAEVEICSLDPYCYVSHLSALGWHGLSDRLPRTIYISRPSRKQWRILADARAEVQLGSRADVYFQCKLPKHRMVEFSKVRGHLVQVWSSRRLDSDFQAAYKRVESQDIRVATIGRCFLDMVRTPELCGGIHHVIEIFEEHSEKHIHLILPEIDAHGNKIEKARAGYLIERALADSHPMLEKWSKEVVRGGSRKLDPSSGYSEEYSERWALSLNA